MKKLILAALLLCSATCMAKHKYTSSPHDMAFDKLATTWDEAVPLGNGFVGELVWQKSEALRFSLDRIDLWDLRASDSLQGDNFSFDWVYERLERGEYGKVHAKLDDPYNALPAPSKIPGAGLEFDITSLGEVASVHLYMNNALCVVEWKNGARLETFVHATLPYGTFRFSSLPAEITPRLTAPAYGGGEGLNDNSHSGEDLSQLGYTQGEIRYADGSIDYHQKGYGDFYYDVAVRYRQTTNSLEGVWAITSSLCADKAAQVAETALAQSFDNRLRSHNSWWADFWSRSSITLPDTVLQNQYYADIYKFGSCARENGYIIPLQGVWTADNGKLPPWKGDVHHDLNTQLSYWPAYAGNYLPEAAGYVNTLWNQRETSRKYTKEFFGCDGINVPGVATLLGEPMGGWTQYSFSPSVSAWLAQHFYLQWQYGRDETFLKQKAYPYVKDVATFIEQFSVCDQNGVRKLPLSSSPEIFDNSTRAWFRTMTNYDLALVKYALKAASEMAYALKLDQEGKHWQQISDQFPEYAIDATGGLEFADGVPYNVSHRHFSNAMAVHPMGLIDCANSAEQKRIVDATIANLDRYGSAWWVGYSFSWLGNMKARAYDGEGAAEALRTFADYFCLKNTFHANGDQKRAGKSNFTYRPFTLEGNFAFASGVQDMLLQSHRGYIEVFPAIPAAWKDASFTTLRTYGACLVSAALKNGVCDHVEIMPEKDGSISLKNPFDGSFTVKGSDWTLTGNKIELKGKAGRKIILTASKKSI